MDNVALGDFDGDGKCDVFYADGTTWKISSGGTGAWKTIANSQARLEQLLFGKFDRDTKLDAMMIRLTEIQKND